MKFKLRQMEIFRAVMITGTISGAARMLFISQPAVSKLLSHTETNLRLKLFHRSKGKLIPTPEAHNLFNEVNQVYEAALKVDAFAENLSANPSGKVHICCSPSLGLDVVPSALQLFSEKYPDTKIHFHTTLIQDIPLEKWQDVPYKGLSQTTTDVIGKQLDLAVVDTPGTTRIINGEQVKAIAVTGDKRHPELPDVPTLKESGYADAIHYSWTALWLKADTPLETVQYLSDNMQAVLSEPSSTTFVSNNSGEIMDMQPEQLRAFQLEEIERFEKAAAQTNFTKL
ncbi:LysR family transcriptional regulator [Advenella kashmirensis W13003]|uniref:LysR family transcriptional regulator n=1 Tax=Advenella kashmirensis W13003 TaxID=1424334 RepID=V8QX78_9BURK|nr:tripartite tricarboxylate transporter substrate-binding protein [Advenella kashmirensis]ETF03925.1 LysR family transcriptional regulator [Advenella kashmirensis W13003]